MEFITLSFIAQKCRELYVYLKGRDLCNYDNFYFRDIENKRVYRLSKFAVLYEIYYNDEGVFSGTICTDVLILEVLRLAQDAVYKNQPYYARALQSIEDSLGIAKYDNALF